jgi:hypothetical protein
VTVLAVSWFEPTPGSAADHVFMGTLFGLLHLAYGAYLYVTEPGKRPV